MTGRIDRQRHEVPTETRIWYEQFRAVMRKRRLDLGMTQHEASRNMGRSDDYVAVLENNGSTVNLVTAHLWVQALGGNLVPDFTPPEEMG